uniref:Myosin binding protein H n=2 Tax=Canis lupus familiaris TaxID=9615 RepID=A0A8I3NSU5_CANLF
MTEEATSEAPTCGPEDTGSEPAQAPPAEPSRDGAASESTRSPTPPEPASQATAPTAPAAPAATKAAPPSEDVPSAPLLLAVEDVSDSSVTVSWEPPESLGRLGLQGYVLELCREGASEWVPVNARPVMVTQQTVRNLALGDKFFLRVAAVSSAGAGPPAVLKQPVHIQQIIEPPKIRVPRHLRQTYIRQVGETVNLQIPFQGSPKPQASWTHDGHALDAQRVNVRTGDQDSILFIRSAQRSDSGCYELTMRLEGLEAKAAIDILVIEKPGPPSSIRLLDVWGCNAALEWMPPQDTGNTELLGYTVQKADRKTGQWFTVLERYHPTTCTISDLIVGNAYSFRVFSENQCGLSATAATTKELARIQKAGGSGCGTNTKPGLPQPPARPLQSISIPPGEPLMGAARQSVRCAPCTPTAQLRTRSCIHTRDCKEIGCGRSILTNTSQQAHAKEMHPVGGCTLVLKLLVAASLTAVTGARVQGPGGAPPGPSVCVGGWSPVSRLQHKPPDPNRTAPRWTGEIRVFTVSTRPRDLLASNTKCQDLAPRHPAISRPPCRTESVWAPEGTLFLTPACAAQN